MKLQWLRAGCASIAEANGVSFNVYFGGGNWYATRTSGDEGDIHGCGGAYTNREAAEAACETWLDQHDKPVWHDATEWLSWAEWRGWKMITCPGGCGRSVCRVANDENDVKCFYDPQTQHAKAAGEKYVRDQTGGAA